MKNKETENKSTSTLTFVFWIIIAIIGTGLLFVGLQNSVLGDSITTSVMLIVFGIIFVFIGLIMVLGKANIDAENIVLSEKAKKQEKK